MSEFDEAVEVLRDLGLSEYEARAYAALLSLGELTAQGVSSAANIPYTKVYEVLRRLEAKGWVVAVSRTPLTYAARRPEEVLTLERRKLEERLRRAEEKLKTLEAAGTVAAGIYVVRSFAALKRAVQSIVLEADELLMMLSSSALLEGLEGALARARVRGIIDEKAQPPLHGEWRRAPIPIPLDIVVGDREKLVLHFGLLSPRGGPSGVLALDREVARAAAEYLERMWERAVHASRSS